jgi:acetyl esterase/lipase
MKKMLVIFFVVIYCFPFSQSIENTRIVGCIAEPTEKTIQIGNKTVEISKDGKFHFNLDIERPAFFDLRYDQKVLRIYVEPNEISEISFNANDVASTLHFKGNLNYINNFLTGISVNDRTNKDFNWINENWQELGSSPVDRFIFSIDSLKNLYFTPLDSFINKHKNVPKSFVNLYKADINFNLNIQLLRYIDYKIFNSNRNYKLVSFSPEINQYLRLFDIDNPDFIGFDPYEQYCDYWFYLKISEELANNPHVYTSDHRWIDGIFALIPELFKNQEVLDYWLYKQMKFYIENNGIKNIEKNIKQFDLLCEDIKFKEEINSLYNNELEQEKDHLIKTYKSINGFKLDAHIFIPKHLKKGEKLPAMVYFHGGSWYEGKPGWDFGFSDKFVNVCIEFRTMRRHGSSVFEEVSDAKSAFRWLRINADELQIDPNKIIGTGTSSGGHLILCAAMCDTLDEPGEDRLISSMPDALILNCVGYDATIYFHESQRERILKISPLHLVKENLPPMLIFHGTNDYATPYKFAEQFVEKMKEKNNYIKFKPIEGSGHAIWENKQYREINDIVKNKFYEEVGIF